MIYTADDIAIEYSKRRKNLSREEAADLLKCLVQFLRKDLKEENEYAYEFPSIGTIYKKFSAEKEENNKGKRYTQMFLEKIFSERKTNLLETNERTLEDFKIKVY